MKKLLKRGLTFLLAVCVAASMIPVLPIQAEAAKATGPVPTEGWMWPVPKNFTIFSPYVDGSDATLLKKRGGFHGGIDISKSANLAVVASRAGTVERVSYTGVQWGQAAYVVLKHSINGQTWYSAYWHLKSGSVKYYNDGYTPPEKVGKPIQKGDLIKQGQQLGITGKTGQASGIHLHFVISRSSSIGDSSGKGKNKVFNKDLLCTNPKDNTLVTSNNGGYSNKQICSGGTINYQKVACDHTFDNGICTKCKFWDPKLLQSGPTTYSATQNYRIKSGGAVVRDGPYDSCASTKLSGGEGLVVTGELINARGSKWYILGGSYPGKYVYSGNVERYYPASTLKITPEKTTYTIEKGSPVAIRGSITSNYPIIYSAKLDGEIYLSPPFVTSGRTAVNLYESKINTVLDGRKLSAGTHTLTILATDTNLNNLLSPKSVNITIKVNGTKNYCAEPTISYTDVAGGKKVTITQNTSGGTLYYMHPGTNKKFVSTADKSVSFDLTESSAVQAYAAKSGMLNSDTVSREITVTQLKTPQIAAAMTGTGATVTLTSADEASIYYALNGQSQGVYKEPFSITADTVVTAYAARNGFQNSETASSEILMRAPDAPSVTLSAPADKVAQGSTVLVSWKGLDNAVDYTVKAYKDGAVYETQANITDTSASFCLEDAAAYTFGVSARNAFGESPEGMSAAVTAMAPVTVVFKDYDETVLLTQQVDYGGGAVAPADPERRGYYFRYWDRPFDAVTEDLEIHPVYQIITYTVTFKDHNGNTIGSPQRVDFGCPASAPDISSFTGPSANYAFVAWSVSAEAADSACDLNAVDSNMTAQAVFKWADSEKPVVITSLTAQYDPDETTGKYTITATLENTDDQFTRALLRVSLKTSAGTAEKLVDTESQTVALRAGSKDNTYTFTLNYPGTAATAEAVVVGYEYSTQTGPAYSRAVSVPVQTISAYDYGPYSDWSTENPATISGWHTDSSGVLRNSAGYPVQVEAKTQYGYKTKTTTTSTSASLSGWTRDDGKTVTNYTAWTNVGWTKTKPTTSSTLQITDTKTVTDQAAYTSYQYYHYYGYNDAGSLYNSYGNGVWKNYESTTSTSAFTKYNVYDGHQSYKKSVSGKHGSVWWLSSGYPKTVAAVTHTEWYYQTRTAYNVYTFYQLSSDVTWQDTKTADTATNVYADQTRTVYRYRVQDQPVAGYESPANQDVSGSTYTFSNTTPAPANAPDYYYVPAALPDTMDLSGKVATVMVYKGKNSDPNESQIQYAGQVTLGENNGFTFSFIPKNEPTTATGDFIVAMSVQGSVGLVNIGLIKAPVEQYTVTFLGDDGSVLGTQTVPEGESAVPPRAPAVEGKTFLMWSESGSNVHGDLTISAKYVPNTYAVAFVDYINETVTPFASEYGTPLSDLSARLETPAAVGYTFDGWDYAEGDTVTGNLVVKAIYTPDTYRVQFFDNGTPQSDGTTTYTAIETQNVAYGSSANPPEAPEIDGMTFLGWGTDVTWWNVTEDMNVYPIYIYDATAEMPVADTDSEYLEGESATISLETEEGGTIYYTLDGTDPDNTSAKYDPENPITLQDTADLRAITVTPGKNESEILEIHFEYATEGYSDDTIADPVDVGTYNVSVEPNKEITLQVQLDENPGLIGYLFLVECDRNVFSVDYSTEDESFVCTPGDLSAGGTMLCSAYEDVGWQVLWFNSAASSGAGNLFSLTLRTDAEAEAGTYPITVRYSPANTVTAEDVEASASSIRVVLGGTNGLLGDVNGDGMITTVDVIRIAKYLIDDLQMTSSEYKVFLANADVNGDGDITSADVVRLVRHLLGLEDLG